MIKKHISFHFLFLFLTFFVLISPHTSYSKNLSVGPMVFSTGAYASRFSFETSPLLNSFIRERIDLSLYLSYESFVISNAYLLDGAYRNSSNDFFILGLMMAVPTIDKRVYFKLAPTFLYSDKYLQKKQFSMGMEMGFGLDFFLTKENLNAFFMEILGRFFHQNADKNLKKDYFNGVGISLGARLFF